MLSLQRAQVPSLVGELRSHMMHSMAKYIYTHMHIYMYMLGDHSVGLSLAILFELTSRGTNLEAENLVQRSLHLSKWW